MRLSMGMKHRFAKGEANRFCKGKRSAPGCIEMRVWEGGGMPQHADSDATVHGGPPETLLHRGSRARRHERVHYKAEKIEPHIQQQTQGAM